MLQQVSANGVKSICEITPTTTSYIDSTSGGCLPDAQLTTTNTCWPYTTPTIYWNSYPVYVCTDKTKKAIEIMKALQAEKLLECKSVPKFIDLVEKIAAIL